MIRITHKQLRGLVREVMEGDDELDDVEQVYELLSNAHEALESARALIEANPELRLRMFSTVGNAEIAVRGVLESMTDVAGGGW